MQRCLLRNRPTLLRGHSLALIAGALLLTVGGRSLQAQSLRSYTLAGVGERVVPPPTTLFRLDRARWAPSIDPSLAALAPAAVFAADVAAASRGTVPRSVRVVAMKAPTLECPMRVARADSSHSSGMPVVLADSAAPRADVGGMLIGCTNPLAR